jgi:hypothetical protein
MAATGGTRDARNAGVTEATTVVTTPTTSETMIVRGRSCSPVLGRSMPKARKEPLEAQGDEEAEPQADQRGHHPGDEGLGDDGAADLFGGGPQCPEQSEARGFAGR